MKTPLKSLKIIKEMYEHFVKTYRELEPKLMICEKEDFDIIETALKDYEMEHTLRIRLENANYELVREKQENEKKLKALEIIKEKRVNVEEFIEMFEDWKEITYEKWIIYYEENGYYIQGNEDFDYNRLTQEEFDFLKEALK